MQLILKAEWRVFREGTCLKVESFFLCQHHCILLCIRLSKGGHWGCMVRDSLEGRLQESQHRWQGWYLHQAEIVILSSKDLSHSVPAWKWEDTRAKRMIKRLLQFLCRSSALNAARWILEDLNSEANYATRTQKQFSKIERNSGVKSTATCCIVGALTLAPLSWVWYFLKSLVKNLYLVERGSPRLTQFVLSIAQIIVYDKF